MNFFRKKSAKDRKSSPVRSTPASREINLNINDSPLFNRRKTGQPHSDIPGDVPPLSGYPNTSVPASDSPKSTHSQFSSNRVPLRKTRALPQQELKLSISPIVNTVQSPQAKDVLSQVNIPNNIRSSINSPTSPLYAEVYRPSKSSITSIDSMKHYSVDSRFSESSMKNVSPSISAQTFPMEESQISIRKHDTKIIRSPSIKHSSNAVIFNHFSDIIANPSLMDEAPSYSVHEEMIQRPKKVLSRNVSVTPHPPVNPVELRSHDECSNNASVNIRANISSIQQVPLPPIPGQENSTYQGQPSSTGPVPPQHLYQNVSNNRDVSNEAASNSSERMGLITSNQQSLQWQSADPDESTGRPGSVAHYSHFKNRYRRDVSMIPREEIETMYRELYMQGIDISMVLEEEPPDFEPPSPVPSKVKYFTLVIVIDYNHQCGL